jgi:CheY-like chemotaxis protein
MNSKKMKILLADDDYDDCLFFKRAISELSVTAELEIVNDGEELMTYLDENSERLPLVLFLDINMPMKNGLECLTEIRQNEKLKDLPIIMFSTSNSWDTINTLFKTGAHVYIHKPNDFAQLKQVIHHAIPLAAEKIFSNNPIKYVLNVPNKDDTNTKSS